MIEKRSLFSGNIIDLSEKEIMTFGRYWHEADTSNGKAPIEWIVLKKEKRSALLLSRYGLDCRRYDEFGLYDITWENSSLREWLNKNFFYEAFSAGEQIRIKETRIKNPSTFGGRDKDGNGVVNNSGEDIVDPAHLAEGGNPTRDKVFLLSIDEVRNLREVSLEPSDENGECRTKVTSALQTSATAYARKQGAYISSEYITEEGEAACGWWLRSPGFKNRDAAMVSDKGSIYGSTSLNDTITVRPAIWIYLEEAKRPVKKQKSSKSTDSPPINRTGGSADSPRRGSRKIPKGIMFALLGLIFLIAVVLAAVAGGNVRRTYPEVNDIINYGMYEQDGNPDNGPEPIAWRVVDKTWRKTLLLSEYALDSVPYNNSDESVTWETCSLRRWLNNDFLNSAFSDTEKKRIVHSKISNPPTYIGRSADDILVIDNTGSTITDPEKETTGGNDTTDQIFLLSADEAIQYLGSNPQIIMDPKHRSCTSYPGMKVAATEYAKSRGARADFNQLTSEGLPGCWWWLRSRGYYDDYACLVRTDSYIINTGADEEHSGVRPAMWITSP